MLSEHIDKLRREYTDKWVQVDDQQPELARFRGFTGLVKTVNMNGRALVQFDDPKQLGWCDIDIDFLKVVDKPVAAGPAKKPAARAATAAKPAAASPSVPAGSPPATADQGDERTTPE